MTGQRAFHLMLAVEPFAAKDAVLVVAVIFPPAAQQAFELAVGADIFAEEHFLAAAIDAPNAAHKTGVRAEAVDPTAFDWRISVAR